MQYYQGYTQYGFPQQRQQQVTGWGRQGYGQSSQPTYQQPTQQNTPQYWNNQMPYNNGGYQAPGYNQTYQYQQPPQTQPPAAASQPYQAPIDNAAMYGSYNNPASNTQRGPPTYPVAQQGSGQQSNGGEIEWERTKSAMHQSLIIPKSQLPATARNAPQTSENPQAANNQMDSSYSVGLKIKTPIFMEPKEYGNMVLHKSQIVKPVKHDKTMLIRENTTPNTSTDNYSKLPELSRANTTGPAQTARGASRMLEPARSPTRYHKKESLFGNEPASRPSLGSQVSTSMGDSKKIKPSAADVKKEAPIIEATSASKPPQQSQPVQLFQQPSGRVKVKTSEYEGEIQNNMRNGTGTMLFADGRRYEGEWKDDRMEGRGRFFYTSGRVCYEGDFVANKFEGWGVLYNEYPEMISATIDFRNLENVEGKWTKFSGHFIEGHKDGEGMIEIMNGEKFAGEFHFDKANGPGKYFVKNGAIINGVWQQDRLIRS